MQKNETMAADAFVILTDLRNQLKSQCGINFFGYHVYQLFANVGTAEIQEATENFRLYLKTQL